MPKPKSLHASITDLCNLRCLHCDLWKTRKGRKEATKEQWIKLIRQLGDWLGYYELHFAGGEPLIRRDLWEIISKANEYGVKTFVTTNATLIDARMSEEISQSGLHTLNVSLDTLDPERFNSLKGSKGAYDRVIKALQHLEPYRDRITIAIAAVIMRYNLYNIEELVEWAIERGYYIGFQALCWNFGTKFDPRWHLKSPLWIKDLEYLSQVIEWLIEEKKKTNFISNTVGQLRGFIDYFRDPTPSKKIQCQVGESNMSFSPYGEVMLCFNTAPVGNFIEQPIKEIWESERAQRMRLFTRRCRMHCAILNCHYHREDKP